LPVLERIRTEGVFHEFGFLYAATEIWLGEAIPQSDEMARLISQAFYQSSCAGLVFCPEFTVCFECGHTARGLHTICPKCESEKVAGLAYAGDRYGLTSSWDEGRLAELKDRTRLETSEL
jgi:anaerobic ribonucleoside-triphosphate reductase